MTDRLCTIGAFVLFLFLLALYLFGPQFSWLELYLRSP